MLNRQLFLWLLLTCIGAVNRSVEGHGSKREHARPRVGVKKPRAPEGKESSDECSVKPVGPISTITEAVTRFKFLSKTVLVRLN